jgi:hypothetical protein
MLFDGGEHEPGLLAVERPRLSRPGDLTTPDLRGACICSSESNSRPRQNESRTYCIGRSTRGLSFGLPARAGSIRQR